MTGAPARGALDGLLAAVVALVSALPRGRPARVTQDGTAVPDCALDAGEDVARALAALVPHLALAGGPGVREVPEVEIMPDGVASLRVRNAEGRREHVTRWYARAGYQDAVLAWSECRTASPLGSTAWDAARRERRVVAYRGRDVLLDPGAAHAVDLLAALGCATDESCEGHPRGAYLSWDGECGPASDALRALGWHVAAGGRGTTQAYMPAVADAHGRDAAWREACAALEALAPAPAP